MKRFFLGLIVGLCICAGVYFAVTPQLSEKVYSVAYAKGMSEGIAQGDSLGRIAERNHTDSMKKIVVPKEATVPKKAKQHPKAQVNGNDKNYNVYGNQVGEPRKDSVR